ncbi:olfactory receptor 6B1-like [Emydura macquarii macquarii]|uniref:olfactory receptor 6B1-like n=1 Tax=Emydura macquarii macquarii TaxID=1129001 RepID=UPI00352B371B
MPYFSWRKEKGKNQTFIAEFILLGFGNVPEMQILLFLLFLVIYTVTVAGNTLIVVLVVADQHLHTPMYFFLGNLSCLETCYTSSILPKMLSNFWSEDKTISVNGCFVQLYFFGSLVATECYLLAAMSYDRYLAICKPLHYATIMKDRVCLQLAAVSWIIAFVADSLLVCLISQLTFCGPKEIDHFFCDFTPMIKLSCNDTNLVVLLSFILCSIDMLFPFLLTVTSYICIISTILRIPSTTGRKKAFSTCSSHLIMVTIFYGTLIIVYMLPDMAALQHLNKVYSIFCTALTPLINPLIYSLRNKEVMESLRKVIQTMRHTQKF